MGAQKIIAILLLIIGTVALTYGGFSYTKKVNQVDIGSLHVSTDQKQRVNMPVWMGVGALLLGGLLLVPRRP